MSLARFKAHTIYKNAAGKRVPGTTTISGVLDKSRFLVPWANNLGLQGIDSSKYVDEKARAGTLAHAMCINHLLKEAAPQEDYTKHEIDQAENSFLKFLPWTDRHKIEVILAEKPLVSEEHQYGGTMDIYGFLDGEPTLIDLKTSKAIYPEHWIQVAGYSIILEELGYPLNECRILQIGRDESEGFREEIRSDLTAEREIFLHCRKIYELQKQVNKKGA